MPEIPDRRVHAVLSDGQEIVRYDRAGHWYLETSGSRVHLRFAQAVALAKSPEAIIYVGLPGGSRFDTEVLKDQA